MTIDILTIFPEMFESVLNASILGRARANGLLTIEATDIRPFSASKHKNTDDYPFGGGAGMLMMAQPIADAIKAICARRGLACVDNLTGQDILASTASPCVEQPFLSPTAGAEAVQYEQNEATQVRQADELIQKQTEVEDVSCQESGFLFHEEENTAAALQNSNGAFSGMKEPSAKEALPRAKRIYLSPRGVPLTQKLAQELSKEESLILLCGHYEGVDQRVLDKYIDLEISIGDYILTGGEVAAMALADCIARLVPGVLGSEESPQDESFSDVGLLEYPQYTRPRIFEGVEVPAVLLNGDHAKIAAWRRAQAIAATAVRRPELLRQAKLSKKERKELGLEE